MSGSSYRAQLYVLLFITADRDQQNYQVRLFTLLTHAYGYHTTKKQESLANAKVSARQQCVYEGP